jgi:protein gp37
MAERTEISWTDATFSPWLGCTKVSDGCNACYAEALMDKRYGRVKWGPGEKRIRTSEANWRLPLAWDRKAKREGRRMRVFCASLADVFDNEVPAEWRADLFQLIAKTTHLDWLLLTKRIGNTKRMLNEVVDELSCGINTWDELPWPGVWIGATVVDQAEADRDIPKLLATPARVRFLSIEPMLGPVSLDCWPIYGEDEEQMLHWVICGAESGPDARPLHIEWVRSIVQQCRAARVACHVKQLGHVVLDSGMSSPGEHWPVGIVREPLPRAKEEDPPFIVRLKHRKGGDPAEWPEDLRVQEFPENI